MANGDLACKSRGCKFDTHDCCTKCMNSFCMKHLTGRNKHKCSATSRVSASSQLDATTEHVSSDTTETDTISAEPTVLSVEVAPTVEADTTAKRKRKTNQRRTIKDSDDDSNEDSDEEEFECPMAMEVVASRPTRSSARVGSAAATSRITEQAANAINYHDRPEILYTQHVHRYELSIIVCRLRLNLFNFMTSDNPLGSTLTWSRTSTVKLFQMGMTRSTRRGTSTTSSRIASQRTFTLRTSWTVFVKILTRNPTLTRMLRNALVTLRSEMKRECVLLCDRIQRVNVVMLLVLQLFDFHNS